MKLLRKKRLASAICAAAMLFSSVSYIYGPMQAAAENTPAVTDSAAPAAGTEPPATAVSENGEPLCQQSFSLYPNGEETGQIITLEGLMPEGASAEAVDVSDAHEGIAAYDITITDGTEEFQPGEECPVLVEIIDPVIPESDSIELWHIRDDGEREQITDFTLEDGKISFYAAGFSVYEIVNNNYTQAQGQWVTIDDIADLKNFDKNSSGLLMYSTSKKRYFSNGINPANPSTSDRPGITYADRASAIPYYFEKVDGTNDQFYIYCLEGGKKYLYGYENTRNEGSLILDSDNKSIFTILPVSGSDNEFEFQTTIIRTDNTTITYYVNYSGNNNKFYLYAKQGEPNNKISLWYSKIDDNPYNLNNAEYGLMYYTGGVRGYSMIADEDPDEDIHTLRELVTRTMAANNTPATLYVDQGSESTMWKFTCVSEDKYKLSAETDEGTMYLAIIDGELTISYNESDAAPFQVKPVTTGTADEKKKIQLVNGGRYVTFQDNGNDTAFVLTADGTQSETKLNLILTSTLDPKATIAYSADRVSISEVQTGEKVIVYTRIWNEDELHYDIYAVDYDGRLVRCDASGGKILWIGDGTCSLEWDFTEYLDEVTKQPNYYYELYNPYSEKYIAPQMLGNQSLSENTIGINMPRRRNGEFYSEIVAWDDSQYAYVGLRPVKRTGTDENGDPVSWYELEPCAESVASQFYFAKIEPINMTDELHTVPTVDNMEHGITMKMVNFDGNPRNGSKGGTEQNRFLINDNYNGSPDPWDLSNKGEKETQGLLSTFLNDNDYPTAAQNPSHRNLSELFKNAELVNHLFIESVYNSSGYFEFDSCQNFATLMDNETKALKEKTNYTDQNGNIVPMRDFTVYRELGTTNVNKTTLQHGQFYPYNYILPNEYAKIGNQNVIQKNMYNTDARSGNNNKGRLPEDDPRKYEKLYSCGYDKATGTQQQVDYYLGMELEASFAQTVSGLDAWGHDIIFNFKGDDDFWLYVDDELVIDLGGVHSALAGSVNFRTGKVIVNKVDKGTLKDVFINNFKERYKKDNNNAEPSYDQIKAYLDELHDSGKGFQPCEEANGNYGYEDIFADYTKHTMRVFYMERGAGASNLQMRFNISSVTPGHVEFSKETTGEGAADLDTDFIEYPFQIFYQQEDENGVLGEEQPLANDNEHIRVTYQGSNQPVRFVEAYRPPGVAAENAYRNVYFINPSKKAEIAFPDKTIKYRIVECAVDTSVYGTVLINGQAVDGTDENNIGLYSYSSTLQSAEAMPTIAFENQVNGNVIKDLYFTKKLYDKDDNEITDDPATFNFRLYLSTVGDISADDLPAAFMYDYCILSADKKMCKYDPALETFVPTELSYSREAVQAIKAYSTHDDPDDDEPLTAYNTEHPDKPIASYNLEAINVIFKTSGHGAISKIPAGFTVCVPGLPVGTVFKVTEDVKSGYGLTGFECVRGDETTAGQVLDQPSFGNYSYYSENGTLITYDRDSGIGRVIGDYQPQLEVHNKKGFGLTVKKQWSDLNLTTSHAPIYTAVYVDGRLLEGSVKQIKSPATSAYYFWPELKPTADGKKRTDFSGYVVKEVKISSPNPTVDSDGNVTNYGTLTVINEGEMLEQHMATRTAAATPEGESNNKQFDYVASYQPGEDASSARTDTITNTRNGGIAVRLFEWNSETPLPGGVFELRDSDGKKLGEFTSGNDGVVTILYDFVRGQKYTLTQKAAPRGYVGLQKKVRFMIGDDDSVSLYYADNCPWGTENESHQHVTNDANWVQGRRGENGITAYVDVHNKQFNFKLMKMQKDGEEKLGSAHFALYKQENTAVSGLVKNKVAIPGFEDMVTDSTGTVYICGGNSDRYLTPGTTGSVYFLTEIQAPFNYKQMTDDIIFRLSPVGVPSIISDQGDGMLIETADCYIYTLSVPNEKEDPNLKTLTVEKKVEGIFGNKGREFNFTLELRDVPNGANIKWAKNGERQSDPTINTTMTIPFTMKHNDKIEVALPVGVSVTLTEENEEYAPTIRLGEETVNSNTTTFVFADSQSVTVTNRLDGIIATGILSSFGTALILFFTPMLPIGIILIGKRKRRHSA